MDPSLLRTFCDLAYRTAGIHLSMDKGSLVGARIGRRIRALGLRSEAAYLDVLRGERGREEMVHFLDAISTHYTYFFREEAHFEHLTAEAERWLHAGRRMLRFWCAGSSTGEEAYTLAMVLEEAFGGLSVDYRILATDLSSRVLETARAGVYDEARASRIPPALRERYFARTTLGAEGTPAYRARPAIRDRIVFARLNLARPPFPMTGPLDAVVCRNVMLYLDLRVREALIGEIERVLCPGGLLYVGYTESLSQVENHLVPLGASAYRKPVVARREGSCDRRRAGEEAA